MLRHFCKMASFSIVDIPVPFLCVPPPLTPKPMLYFRPLSLSFTLDNIDSGVGGGGVMVLEIFFVNIKGMKLLIKARVLNKYFNCFCP